MFRKQTQRNRRNATRKASTAPRKMKVTPSISKPVAAAIAKEVKKDINKFTETKYNSIIGSAAYNNSIGSADAYPLLPPIAQGNDDFERVGSKITPVYLRVKIALQPRDASLYLNQALPPISVRVLILQQKDVRLSTQLPAAFSYNALLDDRVGTSTARQYTGDFSKLDNLAQINKDLFHVYYDKKVKFHGENTSGNTGAVMTMLDRARYLYATIKLPKLFYDSYTSTTYPTNAAPFISFGFVHEGATAPSVIATPLQVNWISTLYYKDD